MEKKTTWVQYYLGFCAGLFIFNFLAMFALIPVKSETILDFYMWSCIWELGAFLVITPLVFSCHSGAKLKGWMVPLELIFNAFNICAGISYLFLMAERWNRHYTLLLPEITMKTTKLPDTVTSKFNEDSIIMYPTWSLYVLAIAFLITIALFVISRKLNKNTEKVSYTEEHVINVCLILATLIFYAPAIISGFTMDHVGSALMVVMYIGMLIFLPYTLAISFLDQNLKFSEVLVKGLTSSLLGTGIMLLNSYLNKMFDWNLPTVGWMFSCFGGSGGGPIYDNTSGTIAIVLFFIPIICYFIKDKKVNAP